MSASADLKCKFAQLKYEQLLSEKYFIETCFSKKYSSYSSKQALKDMWFEIRANETESIPTTTIAAEIDCVVVETTTSTSTSTTSTSTTTSSTTTSSSTTTTTTSP